jgi:LTXXQ motif family protein
MGHGALAATHNLRGRSLRLASHRGAVRRFAHNGFWSHRFRSHGLPRRFGRHFHGYGWYGPVFWPYAYGDIFAFALWPYAYYDPFWDYEPDWIWWSLFWPLGEPGYVNYGDYYAYYDIYGVEQRSHRASARTTVVSRQYQQYQEDACGSLAPGVTDLPFQHLQKVIQPTSEQQAALDDLNAASAKGVELLRQSCPTEPPLTPPAKLDAVTARLKAMEQVIDMVGEPLDRLYSLLSDDQRKRFDYAALSSSTRAKARAGREKSGVNLEDVCSERGPAFTDLPAQQIEKMVSLNDAQRQKLEALKAASTRAANAAKAGCISSIPSTVAGRLDATKKRVAALLEAADIVRPAVSDFYASLSDEQKARFNSMGQPTVSSSNHG